MKQVVQVWTHKSSNSIDNNYSWGLGDLIRGTARTYEICKQKGYNFFVDMTLHSGSNYFVEMENPYRALVQAKKDNMVYINYETNLEDYITSRHNDEIIILSTNSHCDYNLDNNCIEFMRKLLKPNNDFLDYCDKRVLEIPYKTFNIIHFRLGDDELIKKQINNYDSLINILLRNKEENDILITDSWMFKKQVQSNIFSFDIEPVHFGYCVDTALLRDTLFEFYLLQKADKIKTYSVYEWISGFVNSVNKIYNVPIESIK